MLRCFYILAIIVVFAACRSNSGKDILPKEKMEKVLWDVAQSSEFLNGFVYYKYPEQNRVALNNAMLDKVFKIHKITKEQFDNTLEYYRKNPEKFKVIVDSITTKQKRLTDVDTASAKAIQ
ncbi:DUF4296 domain-containing protein [Niabella ginsengisoli]|nr:DUF4296 domain-containing protein [Niabella ginsengisoli]